MVHRNSDSDILAEASSQTQVSDELEEGVREGHRKSAEMGRIQEQEDDEAERGSAPSSWMPCRAGEGAGLRVPG